ncbi:MAG: hypothetical protein V1676_07005 [Candidatus Diapherotrites archaeon]
MQSICAAACSVEYLYVDTWLGDYSGNPLASNASSFSEIDLRGNFLPLAFDENIVQIKRELGKQGLPVLENNGDLYYSQDNFINFYNGTYSINSYLAENIDCVKANEASDVAEFLWENYFRQNDNKWRNISDEFLNIRNMGNLVVRAQSGSARVVNLINWSDLFETGCASSEWEELPQKLLVQNFGERPYMRGFCRLANGKKEFAVIYKSGPEYNEFVLIKSGQDRLLKFGEIDGFLLDLSKTALLANVPTLYYWKNQEYALECGRKEERGVVGVNLSNRTFWLDANSLEYYDTAIDYLDKEAFPFFGTVKSFCEEQIQNMNILQDEFNRLVKLYHTPANSQEFIFSSIYPSFPKAYGNDSNVQTLMKADLYMAEAVVKSVDDSKAKYKEKLDEFIYRQGRLSWEKNWENWEKTWESDKETFRWALLATIVIGATGIIASWHFYGKTKKDSSALVERIDLLANNMNRLKTDIVKKSRKKQRKKSKK